MYSVRRLDGFSLTPNHEMRFSPFRAFPPIQSRYTQLSISPPSIPFSRAAASDSSIRFAVPRPYSAWRDATPPSFSPRSLHDWRGEFVSPLGSRSTLVLLSLCSPLPYPSNRLLALLLVSLSARRLGVSPAIRFPIWQAGRMRVFRVHIRFPVDFAVTCDTLNRYTCGRGGTADTPDLGSGGEIRVGSNPTARTMATHSPPS